MLHDRKVTNVVRKTCDQKQHLARCRHGDVISCSFCNILSTYDKYFISLGYHQMHVHFNKQDYDNWQ